MFIDKKALYGLAFRMFMTPMHFVISFSILLLHVNLFSPLLYSEETVTKEKIWSLISQNEPSLVPMSMVEKLFPMFNKMFNLLSRS